VNAATDLRPEVTVFLDHVRHALTDLDEEERDELLDGLLSDRRRPGPGRSAGVPRGSAGRGPAGHVARRTGELTESTHTERESDG
jgi:hypothetical protein